MPSDSENHYAEIIYKFIMILFNVLGVRSLAYARVELDSFKRGK